MSTYELDNKRKLKRMLVLTFVFVLILLAIFLIVYGSFKSNEKRKSENQNSTNSQKNAIDEVYNHDRDSQVIFSIQENVTIENSRCDNIREYFKPKPTMQSGTQSNFQGGLQTGPTAPSISNGYQFYQFEQQTSSNPDAYSNDKSCAIFTTTPKPYAVLSGYLTMRGYVFSSTWATGENSFATARVFDSNDKPLSIGYAVLTTTDTGKMPIQFKSDIHLDTKPQTKTGYIDIYKTDETKGLKYIHRIPVSFK